MKKIILDCDPGMDDSVAIIMAMESPEIDLAAVTTVNGNYPAEVTAQNALKIENLTGRYDVPVAKGMSCPMVRPVPKDPFTHGSDGQAEMFLSQGDAKLCEEHAVNLIRRLVADNPGEITIVCTGPMSNVAMAMRMYPEIIPMIKSIVAISGAFGLNSASFLNATGDTPQSEWNVYVDPEAAKIVYESGVDLQLIGLDIATDFAVDFTAAQLDRLASSGTKKAGFLSNAIDFVRKRGFGSYCAVIDAMAVACVICPELVSFKPFHVGVDTRDGLTLGMTVRDGRHHFVWENLPLVQVAVKADYESFLALVIDLMCR